MKESDIRFTKFLVLVNAGVPALLLAWDAWHHQLGANPVNFAILTTGMLTLVFLMLTLLVTPLRKITGWNWLIFYRRTLGLYAFFYACAHFSIFFALDRSFSVSSTLTEMVRRKYLIIGSLGLLSMVPLAVTSTNGMLKRMGANRWHALHRLVYVAAVCGVIHYYMQVKADVRQPLAFAGVLTVLLGYRVVTRQNKTAQPAASRAKIWSGPLRVARIVQETPEVRTFRFTAPDGGPLPFQHQPGQYLVISPVIGGRKVNRPYTISSSPTKPDYCEITVKREENGRVSRHLHDTLREGDTLNISAPTGRFIFDGTQAKSIVLIAGGVGITPLMAIARYLTDKNWKGDIYFAYAAKTPGDIIFRKELDDLKARFPNLHAHVTLSRAEDTDWTGHKGRVSAEFLMKCIPELPARLVYICGPDAMMAMTVQVLKDLGVPASQIKLEEFIAAKKAELNAMDARTCVSAPDVLAPNDGTGPKLKFSRSGKSVALAPDKPLLEIAEEAGVEIDFECRSGICGRCKTRLLGGCVTMETQDALDDDDKSKNIILMCQARATEPVTVEA
ncbi:MAG TPA: ferric reductase-like transmembrane domain-containing protein [Candidatus Acidoferrum sp.]|nr:ferric reductase-like transmembrane domain-containing protein [Candidatus Acidoferrum sp.]